MMTRFREAKLALVGAMIWNLSATGCGDDGATPTTGDTGALTTTGEASTTGTGATPTTDTGATPTTGTGATPTTGEPTTDDPTTGDPTTGDTGTTTAVSASSTGGACDPPTLECGGECVDAQTDPQHCGGCDQPCADDELCSLGACVLDCAPLLACGDVCVDTQSDPQHCGDCDVVCEPDELCGAGECVLDCPMGLEQCGGGCIDIETDAAHCGGCDMPCAECQSCSAGSCEAPGLLPAPAAIGGETEPCAGAEASYTVPEVPGAMTYTWTAPNGATVTSGQGTASVKVKFADASGQLCVTYNDGCADSQPSCVAIELSGGVPGQKVFGAAAQIQNFVVPACISTLKITAFGAQGGSTDGGKGARMVGNFAVTPGETLGVVVGKQGVTNTCGGAPSTGGGGGGSFVWHDNNKVEPMIAAGGGGGGNVNWGDFVCRKGLDGVITINGTAGNGAMSAAGGVNGLGGAGNAPSGTGAGGAGWKGNGQDSTWNSPSTGGKAPFDFSGGLGSPGFGPGGEGGFGGGGGAVCGAGGGGGYSGGGAGEGNTCRAGGGGGGSFNSGMNQDNLAGARLGDGEVTLVWP